VELWARMLSGNFAEMMTSTPFRDLLHAANLWHGTDGSTSPLKEGVRRIFFALKNPTASAGFEPANLGTKGQHATPRPHIHKLQSKIPCADVLGLCKLQDKTVLCYTHYIMKNFPIAISFSVLERTKHNISVKLLQFCHNYTEKTVHWNGSRMSSGAKWLEIKKLKA